eukprot:CAMPEP_0114999464 /NCGR_PEP_ID=MMETSP0216-20121206/16163_1 /TAXON_ID=223996 /ORGANISM="Protocruzia adherens, Strain Boccale" /LENGTH=91 /DNA_ID=CAMNT_0002364347 /DNA_START=496 /DNA_END=771 /DNA_ORIENTATION=-
MSNKSPLCLQISSIDNSSSLISVKTRFNYILAEDFPLLCGLIKSFNLEFHWLLIKGVKYDFTLPPELGFLWCSEFLDNSSDPRISKSHYLS